MTVKRILISAAALLAAVVSQAQACDVNVRCAVVKDRDGYMNLRTGPTTQSKIIMPVTNGMTIVFDETVNNWVHVLHVSSTPNDGSIQGWMSKSGLKNITNCD
jgi:uncharacterized protein YgiM (DUF1202 family)